jgi:hypothetical protein
MNIRRKLSHASGTGGVFSNRTHRNGTFMSREGRLLLQEVIKNTQQDETLYPCGFVNALT